MGRHRPASTTSTTSAIPTSETGHPRVALRELEARGYPPELVRAVASHADFLGVSRDSPMEKTLYAVDELSGFLMACAYVRPQGIHGLTPKSVQEEDEAAVVRRRGEPRGAARRAPRTWASTSTSTSRS